MAEESITFLAPTDTLRGNWTFVGCTPKEHKSTAGWRPVCIFFHVRIDDRWDDEFNGTKLYDSPGSGQVATLSRQMLSAVAYMHHLSVAHRDIKPSNWLIAARGFFPVFKLSDFGLAVEFQPGERMTKTCGSFMYMAPEVFNKSYTELCDVWSSGMVIYELVCGKPFFTNIPEGEMEAAVCKAGTCEVKLEEREWNHQRPWLKTWLQQMLVKESGRPAASMALNHPEIQRAKWTGKCQCNAPWNASFQNCETVCVFF